MIVSETLAKIYVAQNEYDEAIKVYEKLIKKEPSRYEHYTGKIKEIRSRPIS
jgi:tetratricopeptide (TPR) repeat protein